MVYKWLISTKPIKWGRLFLCEMMIDYGDCKKYKYYNVKQEQAMIYKTLHRKLMIGQHELN
jgi:hypothetical protein